MKGVTGMEKLYRLNRPTLSVNTKTLETITLAEGEVIAVGDERDDRMVNVTWHDKSLMMFRQDVMRCKEVTGVGRPGDP
jgi:hypothetical protein